MVKRGRITRGQRLKPREPRQRCGALMAEDIDANGIPRRTRYCRLKPYHGTDHKDRWGFWWFQSTPITKADQRHHDEWNGVTTMTKKRQAQDITVLNLRAMKK